jgi:hypothetical protein
MNIEFLKFLLFLLISLTIVNIVGKFCLAILNIKIEKKYCRLFIELVLGLIAIVVIYSIIITSFMTVNILFFLVFIYYKFFLDRRKLIIPSYNIILDRFRNIHKDIFILFLLCLPFFLFESWLIYSPSGYNLPHFDYFLYANLSEALNTFKKENTFFSLNEFFPDQYNYLVPYHYFELWLNALACRAFHCISLFSLLLITYPLLCGSVVTGLIAFWELYFKVNLYTFLTIFFMFFVGGVWISCYKDYILLSDNGHYFYSTPFTVCGKKFAVIYLFFTLFLLLFLKNKKKEAFMALGCLCIIFINIAPAIIGGILIYLVFNGFHKTFSRKENWIILSFYIILPMGLYLLYFIINPTNYSKVIFTENNFLKNILFNIGSTNYLKYFLDNLIYKWIRMIIVYLPFLAFLISMYFLFIRKNKDFLHLVLIVLLLNFSGSIMSIIGDGLPDVSQFFQNTFAFNNVLLIFLMLFGLIYLISNKDIKKRLFYVLIFLITFLFIGYNIFQYTTENIKNYCVKYSRNYIEDVAASTTGNCINSVCLIAKKENENEKLRTTSLPGYIMQYSRGYKNCINISSFQAYDNKDNFNINDRVTIENSIFYLFIKCQIKNGSYTSYKQSQIDFIDKYHIKFLFAEKDAEISNDLKGKILNIVVDTLSGEQFYILKNDDPTKLQN